MINKKIVITGVFVGFGIAFIYYILKPAKQQPEDLAGETKPILTTA